MRYIGEFRLFVARVYRADIGVVVVGKGTLEPDPDQALEAWWYDEQFEGQSKERAEKSPMTRSSKNSRIKLRVCAGA